MKLTHAELEFLSAWAREEWEPACYDLPAHRLQLAHGVVGTNLSCSSKLGLKSKARRIKRFLPQPSMRNPAGRGPQPGTSPTVWQKRASGKRIGKEGNWPRITRSGDTGPSVGCGSVLRPRIAPACATMRGSKSHDGVQSSFRNVVSTGWTKLAGNSKQRSPR